MDYNSFESANIEYLVNIIKRFNVSNIADLIIILKNQYQSVLDFISQNNEKIKFLIDNNSSNQGVYSGNNITNIQNINQYSNVITNNFSDNNGTYNALSFNNINGTNKDNSDDKVLEIYYYNNKETQKEECLYICERKKCSFAFEKLEEYENHIRTHLNNTKFLCQKEGCQKIYSSIKALKRHTQKFHYNLKYQCKNCEKEYKDYSAWSYHNKKFHLRLTPFECNNHQCQKKFPTKSSYQAHTKSCVLKKVDSN